MEFERQVAGQQLFEEMKRAVKKAVAGGASHGEILGFVEGALRLQQQAGLVVNDIINAKARAVRMQANWRATRVGFQSPVLVGLVRSEYLPVAAQMLKSECRVVDLLRIDVAWFNPEILRGAGPTFHVVLDGVWRVDSYRRKGHSMLGILAHALMHFKCERHPSWDGFFEPTLAVQGAVIAPIPNLRRNDVLDLQGLTVVDDADLDSGFCYLRSAVYKDRNLFAMVYGPHPRIVDMVEGPLLFPNDMMLCCERGDVWHVTEMKTSPVVAWMDLVACYHNKDQVVYASEEFGVVVSKVQNWAAQVVGASEGRDWREFSRFDGCEHLFHSYPRSVPCDKCSLPFEMPWRCANSMGCAAINSGFEFRSGLANLFVDTWGLISKKPFDLFVDNRRENQVKCVEIASSGSLSESGIFVAYYLPAGINAIVNGFSLQSGGVSTVVAGFFDLSITVMNTADKPMHIGVSKAGADYAVQFIHRYLGFNLGDHFHRFALTTGAQVWWRPGPAQQARQSDRVDGKRFSDSALTSVKERRAAVSDKVYPGHTGLTVYVEDSHCLSAQGQRRVGTYALYSKANSGGAAVHIVPGQCVAVPAGVPKLALDRLPESDAIGAVVFRPYD